jgi:hypothetical protein
MKSRSCCASVSTTAPVPGSTGGLGSSNAMFAASAEVLDAAPPGRPILPSAQRTAMLARYRTQIREMLDVLAALKTALIRIDATARAIYRKLEPYTTPKHSERYR